jgi:hypothetical protein
MKKKCVFYSSHLRRALFAADPPAVSSRAAVSLGHSASSFTATRSRLVVRTCVCVCVCVFAVY